jgi:hypothetical protein
VCPPDNITGNFRAHTMLVRSRTRSLTE